MFYIQYKFKSAKDYSAVSFDTSSIPLSELKEKILEQSNLKKTDDFELSIEDSATGEVYTDTSKYSDHTPIAKNTSVIVSRVPSSRNRHRGYNPKFYDTNTYHKRKQSRVMKPDYVCHRCGKKGHFIDECPTNGNPEFDHRQKFKKTTGIPKTFLKPVEEGSSSTNQTLRTSSGSLVVMKPNEHIFERHAPRVISDETSKSIPEDYKCPLCQGLLEHPLMIRCCGFSFCSDCIGDDPTDSFLCPTCKNVTTRSRFIENKKLADEIRQWKEKDEKGEKEEEKDKEEDSLSENENKISESSNEEETKDDGLQNKGKDDYKESVSGSERSDSLERKRKMERGSHKGDDTEWEDGYSDSKRRATDNGYYDDKRKPLNKGYYDDRGSSGGRRSRSGDRYYNKRSDDKRYDRDHYYDDRKMDDRRSDRYYGDRRSDDRYYDERRSDDRYRGDRRSDDRYRYEDKRSKGRYDDRRSGERDRLSEDRYHDRHYYDDRRSYDQKSRYKDEELKRRRYEEEESRIRDQLRRKFQRT